MEYSSVFELLLRRLTHGLRKGGTFSEFFIIIQQFPHYSSCFEVKKDSIKAVFKARRGEECSFHVGHGWMAG